MKRERGHLLAQPTFYNPRTKQLLTQRKEKNKDEKNKNLSNKHFQTRAILPRSYRSVDIDAGKCTGANMVWD
jgi:hypothetical protein